MKKIKNLIFAGLIILILIAPTVFAEKCYVNVTKTVPITIQVPYNVTRYEVVKEGLGQEICKESKWPYNASKRTEYTNIDGTPYFLCSMTINNNAEKSENWTMRARFERNGLNIHESEAKTLEIEGGSKGTATFLYKEPKSANIICYVDIEKYPVKRECQYSFYQEKKKPVTVTLYKNITEEVTVVEPKEVPCETFETPKGLFKKIWYFFKYLFS